MVPSKAHSAGSSSRNSPLRMPRCTRPALRASGALRATRRTSFVTLSSRASCLRAGRGATASRLGIPAPRALDALAAAPSLRVGQSAALRSQRAFAECRPLCPAVAWPYTRLAIATDTIHSK